MGIAQSAGGYLFLIFALPALLTIVALAGTAPSMPDPQLTPGAVADTDPAIRWRKSASLPTITLISLASPRGFELLLPP
jgi:hypothetical protein